MGVDFEIDDWCIYCILVLRFGNIFCRTAMLYFFFFDGKKEWFLSLYAPSPQYGPTYSNN